MTNDEERVFEKMAEYLRDRVRGTEAPISLARVFDDCAKERIRQFDKFGDQSTRSLGLWGLILGEEYGEALREACDLSFEKDPIQKGVIGIRLRTELIETMAVCAAIVEAGDRHGWHNWPDETGLVHKEERAKLDGE